MKSSTLKNSASSVSLTTALADHKFTNWELFYVFLGFLSMVVLAISIWVSYRKDGFYPWVGGPWSPPFNYPTRVPPYYYPYDIRGDPVYNAPRPRFWGNGYLGRRRGYWYDLPVMSDSK